MPSMKFPVQRNAKNFTVNSVYIKADTDTIDQYCVENGLTLVGYETENQRFSNDGILVYQYYDLAKTEWKTASGYDRVVGMLDYTI